MNIAPADISSKCHEKKASIYEKKRGRERPRLRIVPVIQRTSRNEEIDSTSGDIDLHQPAKKRISTSSNNTNNTDLVGFQLQIEKERTSETNLESCSILHPTSKYVYFSRKGKKGYTENDSPTNIHKFIQEVETILDQRVSEPPKKKVKDCLGLLMVHYDNEQRFNLLLSQGNAQFRNLNAIHIQNARKLIQEFKKDHATE